MTTVFKNETTEIIISEEQISLKYINKEKKESAAVILKTTDLIKILSQLVNENK